MIDQANTKPYIHNTSKKHLGICSQRMLWSIHRITGCFRGISETHSVPVCKIFCYKQEGWYDWRRDHFGWRKQQMTITVLGQLMVLFCDTFRAMISNPETLKTFSMSRTCLLYVIGHDIGPVFKEELISEIRASKSPFSLQYDETTQCQVTKVMELHIQ